MEIKFILNDLLNKALITERIKQPNSNNIADFVNKYLEAINYTPCCKSDSEQLPNMTLEQAIAKAKPNLDKITDVDKHIEDIR